MKKLKNKKATLFIGLLLLFASVLCGYFLLNVSGKSLPLNKIYTSSVYKYQIRYPSKWSYSYHHPSDMLGNAHIPGLPNNEAYLDHDAFTNLEDNSVNKEEYLHISFISNTHQVSSYNWAQEFLPPAIMTTKQHILNVQKKYLGETTIGGSTASIILMTNQDFSEEAIFVSHGNLMYMFSYPPESKKIVSEMLNSFQFLQ